MLPWCTLPFELDYFVINQPFDEEYGFVVTVKCVEPGCETLFGCGKATYGSVTLNYEGNETWISNIIGNK